MFKYFAVCFSTLVTIIPIIAQTTDSIVVVSADKMNVLYIGVDNPISVAVAGFSSSKISATISNNGTLTQTSPGRYLAKVSVVGKTEITVYAEMQNGSKKLMGAFPFRVKRIDPPVAKIGGFNGGEVKATLFKVQRGIIAVLDGFDYDVRFQVVDYEMTYMSPGKNFVTFSTEGPLFSKDMIKVIELSQSGDKFIFDKINVRRPDSSLIRLNPLIFTLIQ